MGKFHRDHILVVGDTHIPFEHPAYLDFVLEIKERCKCGTVVHIGDLVDNHALSFRHDADPNGLSPSDEIAEAKKRLKRWYKAFPKGLFLCRGNHDSRASLKAKHVGLPEICFREFRQIWELPKNWRDDWSWEIDGVIYEHGTGYSGENAHMKASYNNRQSTVIGHTHHSGAIGYLANEKEVVFGMVVGCGILRKTYAFEYGRDFKKKPILSCGVVTDRGKFAQVFPMDLGGKQ